MSDTCRSCGSPIMWVVTEASALKGNPKSMPLDPEPTTEGNVELIGEGRATKARVHAQPSMLAEGPMYLSHFVTCPEADEWRTKK